MGLYSHGENTDDPIYPLSFPYSFLHFYACIRLASAFFALNYLCQLYQLLFLILICRLHRRLEYNLPACTIQTIHFILYLASFAFYIYFMSSSFGPFRLYITCIRVYSDYWIYFEGYIKVSCTNLGRNYAFFSFTHT